MQSFKIVGGFILIGLIFVLLVSIAPKNKNVEFDTVSGLTPTIAININEQKNSQPPVETVKEITKLEIKEDKIGTGEEAVVGKKVTVHYTGIFPNGKKFDSSIDRGTPFAFTLGAGEVIKGWDQGVVGMKVGGRRRLLIPADLAYGERGAGSAIPPNTPLIFAIELLKVE